MPDPQIREPLKDYLKAVNDQIAVRESVGVGATPYLLVQKAELEAALGLTKAPEPAPEPAPEVKPEPVRLEAEVERKDAEPAPETAVPEAARRPGRPKKNPDDSTTDTD
jgi:hypothetical protein